MGEEGTLVADYSEVEPLQSDKVEEVKTMIMTQSFTKNELREALGYEASEADGMDEVYVGLGNVPLGEEFPGIEDTEKFLKTLPDPGWRQNWVNLLR